MTTRRGFMAGLLALGTAPAIVRADSLMKIVVPSRCRIITFDGRILDMWSMGVYEQAYGRVKRSVPFKFTPPGTFDWKWTDINDPETLAKGRLIGVPFDEDPGPSVVFTYDEKPTDLAPGRDLLDEKMDYMRHQEALAVDRHFQKMVERQALYSPQWRT